MAAKAVGSVRRAAGSGQRAARLAREEGERIQHSDDGYVSHEPLAAARSRQGWCDGSRSRVCARRTGCSSVPRGTRRCDLSVNRWVTPPPDPRLTNPADLGEIQLDDSVETHAMGKLDMSAHFHFFCSAHAAHPLLLPYLRCRRWRAGRSVPRVARCQWAGHMAQRAHKHVLLRPDAGN
eukprot:TRINITY_DN2298_c0_g2_i1.p1 TRINITY_DN2298_c0_g2~~TRINITY_DN2298_c0_g2_i1.p1  ORF type:complete len:179 (-),score=0.50 TRINITY_DN2298_c0_g2_i1:259-795(-)